MRPGARMLHNPNLQIQEIPDALACIVCKRPDVPCTTLFPSLILSASGFEIR
jgi:hypothetical protein